MDQSSDFACFRLFTADNWRNVFVQSVFKQCDDLHLGFTLWVIIFILVLLFFSV